jgi:hypothetical protein
VPSLFEPRWYSDEGILATVGQAIVHGRRLYADAWDNQGPVVYAWMAGVVGLTHGVHWGMQLVLALQVAIAALAIAYISARLGGNAAATAAVFALVAALPVVEGDIQNTELIAIPMLACGIALGLAGGRRRLLAGGALVAAAALCRPGFGIDGLCLLWLLWWSDRRGHVGWAVMGAVVATAAVLGWLWSAGSLPAYLEVLAADRRYLVWANSGEPFLGATTALRLAPYGTLLLLGLWLGRRQRSPAALLLGAWLPLSLVTSILSPRGFAHYALEALAPIAILVGLRLRLVQLVPAAAAVAVLLQGLVGLQPAELRALGHPAPELGFSTRIDWENLPAYYRGWFEAVTQGRPWQTSYYEVAASTDRFGEILRPPSDRRPLEVWGELPWLYIASGRDPAERFTSHNSAWRLEPGHEQKSVEEIIAARPAYIVVAEPAPATLRALLGSAYELIAPGGPWPVWRRL